MTWFVSRVLIDDHFSYRLCTIEAFSHDFFSDNSYLFNELSSRGLTPDKYAVSDLLTKTMERDLKSNLQNNSPIQYLLEKNLSLPAGSKFLQTVDLDLNAIDEKEDWEAFIHNLQSVQVSCNGCDFYKKAIIEFSSYLHDTNDFVYVLLCNIVKPLLSDLESIARVSYAFKRLSEIWVSVCDVSEEMANMSFEEQSINYILQFQENKIEEHFDTSALFPSAMSALDFLLNSLQESNQSTKYKKSILNSSYFELKKHCEAVINDLKHIDPYNSNLTYLPDLVIADIHPNSAASNKVKANDILHIMSTVFKKAKDYPDFHCKLILDVTLNASDDIEFKVILDSLKKHLDSGKLSICLLSSYTKLVQLGSDVLSGGSIILSKNF